MTFATLDVDAIASTLIGEIGNVGRVQTRHRIKLIKAWEIEEGWNLLELGCGQGDCTVALAEAVGQDGHVTAVDPGPADYGSPATLGQAQAYISAGRLGSRITFVQENPIGFLKAAPEEKQYDAVVLCQCLWYFASLAEIEETLALLATRTKRILVSEFALASSELTSLPHLLSVIALGALAHRDPAPTTNVRTLISPEAIRRILVENVKCSVVREGTVEGAGEMQDGTWESSYTLSKSFETKVNKLVSDERERNYIFTLRDAVKSAKEKLTSKVTTMDIWFGSFTTN
ncbi:hypothetical protein SISSUDRAFT_1058253 [Sistotremastrum suecicum HHB10207 ss-3]|uniref:Methyltransferase domain-containing protein n=1 Tax=Sistotremastrum suecicum HHB10207 ss-3 TaxID=1314776 RepID=A0A166HJJ1_9AGAM|nr:hypothetical protein SISSUDRAFT_1058253 [Sistotremastrum suecicum HHB10207 ss-3]